MDKYELLPPRRTSEFVKLPHLQALMRVARKFGFAITRPLEMKYELFEKRSCAEVSPSLHEEEEKTNLGVFELASELRVNPRLIHKTVWIQGI